jgi:H+-translocating NAD(P) transhydrogenase subunit alpha
MDLTTTLTGFVALYIFMLAAFTGYEIIGRVPAILHTPLMSGSNFVHGIVVVGAMFALLNATSTIEQVIGFVGVLLGAGNAAGGYVVTERMLEMFKPSAPQSSSQAVARSAQKQDAQKQEQKA